VDALEPADAADFAGLGQDVTRELASGDGAMVAAIDGAVRGAGLDLALASEVRVRTERSPGAGTGAAVGPRAPGAGLSGCRTA